MERFFVFIKRHINDIVVFIFLFTLFCAVLSQAFVAKGENAVFDKVIRLHVLANSDSERDRQLKLKVRDSIVDLTGRLFADCTDIEQAKEIALKSKDEIQACAEKTVRQNGFDYAVSVEMGCETYPVRRYGDFVFPAGDYFSTRVLIGNGEGKNWWCVLFPPMCSSVYANSTEDDIDLLQSFGFTQELAYSLFDSDVPEDEMLQDLQDFGKNKTQIKVTFKLCELIDKYLKK